MKAPSILLSLLTLFATTMIPPSVGAPALEKTEERIDFERARTLMQKRRSGATLTPEETAYLERARRERRDSAPAGAGREIKSGATVGFKPLTEMTAEDRYKE